MELKIKTNADKTIIFQTATEVIDKPELKNMMFITIEETGKEDSVALLNEKQIIKLKKALNKVK